MNEIILFEPSSFIVEYKQYWTKFTDEFKAVIEEAMNFVYPFAKADYEKLPRTVAYFLINGDDGNGYDTCDSDDCEESLLAELTESYPNDEIEMRRYHNDGDHEGLELCHQCGKYLNSQLTWIRQEWDYIKSETKSWCIDFYKNEAFTIHCILEAIPSNDVKFSKWAGEEVYFKDREEFYREIADFCLNVISTFKNCKEQTNEPITER